MDATEVKRLNRDALLWLLLALVFLIRVPFLHQAIQGDDVNYLAAAQHAQVEPLHPHHVRYVYQGDEVDMRGHSHGPLNGWILAAILAATGDIREFPFHAAYLVFSFIAAASMWWLAIRFSPHPLWASLLFVAVPAFVINGTSLEADLPFLAFWLAGIALFCAGRLPFACICMALAALCAYQGVFLTPILAVWVWLNRRRDARAWLAILTPIVVLGAWQLSEFLSTGAVPAGVLGGYFRQYAFQALAQKLNNAAALSIHACWMVFPALLPPAAVLAWRRRRDPDTLFLLAWMGLFFAGALVVFFAGSARYLLPMAAPLVLLVSRLQPRWLAPAFVFQLLLGLGLAWVNYQHWDGYRQFARDLAPYTAGRRVWINGEWGLRYYLEAEGGLALRKDRPLRPGDVVVSSALAYPVEFNDPVSRLTASEIHATLPLRIIGLDTRSAYSSVDKGLLPFGLSTGPIDRVRADLVMERRPVLEYLPMTAAEQMVSGFYQLEDGWRWIGPRAVALLKSPSVARPVEVRLTIPEASPARRVRLLLDDREVAAETFPGPGHHRLESPPILPSGPSVTVSVVSDQSFSVPGDRRKLSVILTGIGFKQKL